MLHRLAIPGLLKRLKIRGQATEAAGIDSLESIPGLLKSFKYRLRIKIRMKGRGSEALTKKVNKNNCKGDLK
jgi:hypothetical protein